ncbi:MAG: hypothetical protein DCC75_00480 [Proteobacteria bacterium]|nr:MAG: hypothetical protein DCC75_00480 [Pseudomonadota bacterium]
MQVINRDQRGLALISVLFLLTLVGALLGAYTIITHTELALVRSSKNSQSGFNAAEAGLNLRAENIREIFDGYDLPEGNSPESVADCDAGDNGSGDFRCRSYSLADGQTAVTFVKEEPGNPIARVIPPGELYEGLAAQEYRYTVTSVGRNRSANNEAILDLTFMSRKIPLFQFAIFFHEDLEFFNGAIMAVSGPVHTNGDLYLSPQSGGRTDYSGQVSTAGTIYRGLKSTSSCSGYSGTARVSSTANTSSPTYVDLPGCTSNRTTVTNLSAWNNRLQKGVRAITVPTPDDMNSFSDGEYWTLADLRLALRLNGAGLPNTANAPTGVEVINVDGSTDLNSTTKLHDSLCTGLISQGAANYSVGVRGPETSEKLRLYREYQHSPSTNDFQRTLEVDMRGLMNCLHRFPEIMGGRALSDETEGGLVFHLTVDGPNHDASQNNYSVRIRNAAQLSATISGAPAIKGLTVVSDQGLVVWGDYNSSNWKPAALLADTLWLLSNSWTDADSLVTDTYSRDGTATTVQAAVVSGIRRTGDANGAAGQDHGTDSNGGGAINVFRFNEWFRTGSGIPDFTYVGSIVSLGPPRRSQSTWGPFTYYSAPNRVWSFETQFNDASKLPPMTPVAVYLKQELFVRNYTAME